MKRIINIVLFLSASFIVFLVVSNILQIKCLFKVLFHLNCPGCGLTRSFQSIISGDFLLALKYNILGIPLFITFIILGVSLLKDIYTNEFTTFKILNIFFQKYYKALLVILFVVFIINNITNI